LLKEIALAEIPEMVYNSNAIENSTLSLEDTEKILSGGSLERKVTIREVFEAKNLAKITETVLEKNESKLSIKLILNLHKRITFLTAKKVIPLSIWAAQNGIKPNVAANKAKRQTIPAFRLREKWMIAQEYNPSES
jgi:hypothetical protein